ncbi:MAG: hypothetical protein OEX76_01775 [Candidatus Bathyarchaeota archaeon]|nr:hypothetical protein [Candidatus Bathyarchaeota archaeon]MDH5712845.1 hypothetical protein [Candidatus Bathyarchaeota archaeon]
MRKALQAVKSKEMENKTFVVMQVIEKLCEFCEKPLSKEEREVTTIQISNHDDYRNLLIKARAHDRVEIDLEESRIYLYDHDYPGDIHPSCVEKYSEKS